jgi:curved DNA-binding protein CbpA
MLRTHYEILKITRDAPQEVVRAAYRALTLKYHPDRHAADPGATEMMALLNSAYETLSDPVKRREYDEWIEIAQARPSAIAANDVPREQIGSVPRRVRSGASRLWRFRHYWVFYVLALVAIFLAHCGTRACICIGPKR